MAPSPSPSWCSGRPAAFGTLLHCLRRYGPLRLSAAWLCSPSTSASPSCTMRGAEASESDCRRVPSLQLRRLAAAPCEAAPAPPATRVPQCGLHHSLVPSLRWGKSTAPPWPWRCRTSHQGQSRRLSGSQLRPCCASARMCARIRGRGSTLTSGSGTPPSSRPSAGSRITKPLCSLWASRVAPRSPRPGASRAPSGPSAWPP
mmetsp:Transcript_101303/g.226172  ORF Transcript_101303/g.226172 Transcript_101303/m.226172 type:complete len:202 (-) Transcript_101303:125-730(-)